MYTRTEQPTQVLKEIVKYIQTEYGPTWFSIKKSKDFTEGPSILYTTLKNIKTFSQTIQDIILPAVLRNAYCLLPENFFLLSLLVNNMKEVRNRAVRLILKCQENPPTGPVDRIYGGIRINKIPNIENLKIECDTWTELVSDDKLIYESPGTKRLTYQELLNTIECKLDPCELGWDFPMHRKSVERAVKLVSEVSKKSVFFTE